MTRAIAAHLGEERIRSLVDGHVDPRRPRGRRRPRRGESPLPLEPRQHAFGFSGAADSPPRHAPLRHETASSVSVTPSEHRGGLLVEPALADRRHDRMVLPA